MAFYLAFFIVLVLALMGILQINFPLGMYLTGIFDILVILGFLLKMLQIGAKVNEQIDIHKGVLLDLKKQVWKAKHNYSLIISQKYSRFIHEKVFAHLLISKKLKPSKRKDYLENMGEIIDIIIAELEYNKETRPLKLMGLKATSELLTSIYAGLVSIIFAVLQTFYSDLIP